MVARCARSVYVCAHFDSRSWLYSVRAEDGGWSLRTLALGPLLLLFSGGRLYRC
jgi:hypothetical protein